MAALSSTTIMERQVKQPRTPSLVYRLQGEIRLLESDFFIVKHLGIKAIIQHQITKKKGRLNRLLQKQINNAPSITRGA